MNNKYDHISDELLFAYSAGELDESKKSNIEKHLSQCGECRKAADELCTLLHDVKACGEAAPAELLGNVMGKVAQESAKRRLS